MVGTVDIPQVKGLREEGVAASIACVSRSWLGGEPQNEGDTAFIVCPGGGHMLINLGVQNLVENTWERIAP